MTTSVQQREPAKYPRKGKGIAPAHRYSRDDDRGKELAPGYFRSRSRSNAPIMNPALSSLLSQSPSAHKGKGKGKAPAHDWHPIFEKSLEKGKGKAPAPDLHPIYEDLLFKCYPQEEGKDQAPAQNLFPIFEDLLDSSVRKRQMPVPSPTVNYLALRNSRALGSPRSRGKGKAPALSPTLQNPIFRASTSLSSPRDKGKGKAPALAPVLKGKPTLKTLAALKPLRDRARGRAKGKTPALAPVSENSPTLKAMLARRSFQDSGRPRPVPTEPYSEKTKTKRKVPPLQAPDLNSVRENPAIQSSVNPFVEENRALKRVIAQSASKNKGKAPVLSYFKSRSRSNAPALKLNLTALLSQSSSTDKDTGKASALNPILEENPTLEDSPGQSSPKCKGKAPAQSSAQDKGKGKAPAYDPSEDEPSQNPPQDKDKGKAPAQDPSKDEPDKNPPGDERTRDPPEDKASDGGSTIIVEVRMPKKWHIEWFIRPPLLARTHLQMYPPPTVRMFVGPDIPRVLSQYRARIVAMPVEISDNAKFRRVLEPSGNFMQSNFSGAIVKRDDLYDGFLYFQFPGIMPTRYLFEEWMPQFKIGIGKTYTARPVIFEVIVYYDPTVKAYDTYGDGSQAKDERPGRRARKTSKGGSSSKGESIKGEISKGESSKGKSIKGEISKGESSKGESSKGESSSSGSYTPGFGPTGPDNDGIIKVMRAPYISHVFRENIPVTGEHLPSPQFSAVSADTVLTHRFGVQIQGWRIMRRFSILRPPTSTTGLNSERQNGTILPRHGVASKPKSLLASQLTRRSRRSAGSVTELVAGGKS